MPGFLPAWRPARNPFQPKFNACLPLLQGCSAWYFQQPSLRIARILAALPQPGEIALTCAPHSAVAVAKSGDIHTLPPAFGSEGMRGNALPTASGLQLFTSAAAVPPQATSEPPLLIRLAAEERRGFFYVHTNAVTEVCR